jgi:hypothetical protein
VPRSAPFKYATSPATFAAVICSSKSARIVPASGRSGKVLITVASSQ